jgi:ubiquinone/menaquinone biosynthesis C-methylase UbiE
MPLTENDRQGLRQGAFSEGVIWADSPYYDAVEALIADQWERFIWPMISDCDFSSVVDLAAGHGRNSQLLREKAGQILVVDINQENVDFCKKRFAGDPRFRFLKNDGCSLEGIADESVSLIYTFDAMVHFDSDVVRNYLREFRRVLRPGGRGFCHHSNYTGNPSGDFREDPNWRNFMSQQLFNHYCAKEGLSVVRSQVIDWSGTPQHDCLTVFEKPASTPARKECVPVKIWFTGEHPARARKPLGIEMLSRFVRSRRHGRGTYTRRHLAAELISPTPAQADAEILADLCDAYGDHVLVHAAPPHLGVPTIASLDLTSWTASRVRLTGVSCEAAILGSMPSLPTVCHLQVRDGERGDGATLAWTERTITSADGWVRLHVDVPPGATMRSLLLVSHMAKGAADHFYARTTFRDIQLYAERLAPEDADPAHPPSGTHQR